MTTSYFRLLSLGFVLGSGLVCFPAACSRAREYSPSGGAGDAGAGQSGEGTGGQGLGGSGTGSGGTVDASGGTASISLDDACDQSGVVACDVQNSTQKLVCSGGRWESNGSCDQGENCDPEDARCSPIVPECADLDEGDTFCSTDDAVLTCGPNLVSTTVSEECEGKCIETSAGAACVPASCGDAKTQTGEECDDGNTDNDDGCTELCLFPFCGDGFPNAEEACDDGNDDDGDACVTGCQDAACGDGFTSDSEECDDGDLDPGDGCSAACMWEVVEIAVGSLHGCARRSDGGVKCWGLNATGGLGIGDSQNRGDASGEMGSALPQVDLGLGNSAGALAAGAGHSCVILQDGRVKCWGRNSDGQLGLGDSSNRGDGLGEMGDALPPVDLGTGRTALALALGEYHSCALLDDGRVKCWGDNGDGQLGLGDMTDRGLAPSELGDALPAVDLGTGRSAVAITAGARSTCAILDNASVKCWGQNHLGQLGLGDAEDRGDASGEMGQNLPTVSLGSGRTAVALGKGGAHKCALLDDDTTKCWGFNSAGQLGLGDTSSRGDGSGEMGAALPIVDLGPGRTAAALALGYTHSCAILDNGTMKCWGTNTYGQLGLSDTAHRGDAASEMGQNLQSVSLGTGRTARAADCGSYHSCALLDDATVKCWGGNDYGQLGAGDTTMRGDGITEMGDNLATLSLW